jgi:citrate lyase subunit beta/citryl-CoA lyase
MRSMLFVPGDRPERFSKAIESGTDAVILDLEDAVAPEQKSRARQEIGDFLTERAKGGSLSLPRVPVWVRINPVSGEALADLAAIIPARPDGVVLPKAGSGSDVERVDHWLEAFESARGFPEGSIKLIPMITETAEALLKIATFVPTPRRVIAMTWGAEDLAAELGATANRDSTGQYLPTYQAASMQCQLAAAAAGVLAIDTVDTEIRDLAAVESRARASRQAGYAGKLAIHPSQIAPLHAAFTPSADEIDWARAVKQAFDQAPNAGALRLAGKLIDRPHLVQAQRILAVADALASR